MFDKIAYSAKLAFVGTSSFVKMFFSGSFSAATTFALGFMLLIYASGFRAGHVGGEVAVLAIFLVFPIQSILLVGTVLTNYFMFGFASGYSLKKVARRLIDDKGEGGALSSYGSCIR